MQRLKGIQLIAASALLCIGLTVQAAFPEKPIHLIVPFPPNGTTDVVARRISQKLSEVLGQTVSIENKGGAGATIGTQIVATAPADGYTLLMATNSHTANPSIYKSLSFDTVKSFTSVIMVGDTPGLIVIHPSVAAKTLPEFIALAKKTSPPLQYGTAGSGTFPHLATELFIDRAGIEMVHIPYKGASQGITDVISGQVQLYISSVPTLLGHIKNGKLRALAVTAVKRTDDLPQIPTVSESGYKGFEAVTWFGLLGPAKLPAAVVSTANVELNKALNSPDLRKKLEDQGLNVTPTTPDEFGKLIKTDMAKWAPVVKDSGAKVD